MKYNPPMPNRSLKIVRILIIAIPVLCLLAIGVYNLPPVHAALAWRVEDLQARIKYAINPPEQAVFVPQEISQPAATPTPPPPMLETMVAATLAALTPTATQTPIATTPPVMAGPTSTPLPSATPTPTLTPLPSAVALPGVKYEDQHNRWNYCGPSNLSMALTFWGWQGNRDNVGQVIKPSDDDKNVMPYEMVNFVESQGYRAQMRYGGTIDLLKKLVAAGYPVVAEKGYYEYDYAGKWGWFGHYQFVTGYDDAKRVLIVQDTYIPEGENHEFPYEDFITGWRSFNYVFLVVYPPDREAEVLALLGEWADPTWASQQALELALAESTTLTGVDQYFAWFNRGTSHVNLLQYGEAAAAYDNAFALYANLPAGGDQPRPYRMMWYQTGPYWAYFYSGRYQDTITLASNTLNYTISKPVLEESLYWRALAKAALGDVDGAIEDYRASLEVHPGFAPSVEQLSLLGVEP